MTPFVPLQANLAVLDGTYREALSLIHEARAWAISDKAGDQAGLDQAEKLLITMEALRVTTRLTNVMAWLMARKAVHAGEIDAEDAARRGLSLSSQPLCLDEGGIDEPCIGERLRTLSWQSLDLYRRVERLDRMLRGQDPAASPARPTGDPAADGAQPAPESPVLPDDPEGKVVPLFPRRRQG